MSFNTGEAEILSSSSSAQPCHLFSLADIQLATNDFDDELVVGRGGFGRVYKGCIRIQKSNHVVAIKRLDSMSDQGELEFRAEIEMLSKLRHPHLVSLIGYCDDKKEMILVYEYMPHGTLHDHLHEARSHLNWVQRLKIAIGAGCGLAYLHTGDDTKQVIIHRDVKSSNFLLDENLAAMISDFGLSKLGPTDQSFVLASVKGTFGYLDPEYFYTKKLTRATDVYAFGVVLFELLSGRLPVDISYGEEQCSLVRWAQKCCKQRKFEQMVDLKIRGTIFPKCLRQFAQIADRCLLSVPKQRPTMTEVLASLHAVLRLQEKQPPSDVKDIFQKYSGDGVHMTTHQFRRFLEDEDGQGGGEVSVSDAESFMEQIISKRQPYLAKLIHRKLLSLEDFHHFLFSTYLNPPIRSQVHQDMNAPLSHYFIYTAHNSYLTGNKLSSNSSEVPIIKALKRGVRVIELDLWPNSSKDNVHVHNGWTLTKPVELLGCLKMIKEYAFIASDYPVIITFEDHLTSDLQAKVAQMVTETFGDMLFCPESEKVEELSAPESLKHRILISTKRPKVFLEAADDKRISSQNSQLSDVDDDAWSDDRSSKSGSDRRDRDHETEDVIKTKISPSSPVCKKLIAIHAGKPKGGLKDALKVEKNKVRLLTLADQGLERAVENHGQDVLRFTQKNILRIYPKGTRITSSNYKPLTAWLHGAQMVAFNMQGYGKSLWLMHGMFRANGGCGYVKKPDFLMKCGPKDEVFSPKAKLPAKITLKVKIYMGDGWHLDFKGTHFDKYSPPDFYTRVAIAGASVDKKMERANNKEDKWSPVWNEEFKFPLSVPELALLRIEVGDSKISEKDGFAGQICLPVYELRPGIRAIPLYNRKGDQYKSARLLVRFEFI